MSRPTLIVVSSMVRARSVIHLVLVLPVNTQPLTRRFARAVLLPRPRGVETHPSPLGIRRILQISRQVGKLFDLRGQYRRFHAEMLAVSDRPKELCGPAAPGYRGVLYFAIPDELRSESGGAAPLAGRTAQNRRVAAVLHDGMRLTLAVGVRDLGNRLKAEYASTAEFAQTRQRVLQSIDLTQRIQFVDHKPQSIARIARVDVARLVLVHRFKDRQTHPRRDGRAQGCDLSGLVGNEQDAGSLLPNPFPDRKS